jgi:type IV secretion system protein TrbI
MFGASAAVGLITGLSQAVANIGQGNGNQIVLGNMGGSASQTSAQAMNHFLNRLPTVTIREGHRVKVYVTHDLELPAYGR